MNKKNNYQTGAILPLTLIILAVLTLMVSSLILKGQAQVDAALRLNKQWQARLAINDAEQRVIFAVLVGDQNPGGYQLGDTLLLTDSTNTKLSNNVWVSIQDHAGLVSLSFIDKSVLRELFRSYVDVQEASVITNAIIEWQQPQKKNSVSQLVGNGGVSSRQAVFRSLDELLLIPGITSRIYNGRRNLAEQEESPDSKIPELPKNGLRDLLSLRGRESSGVNLAVVPDALLSRVYHMTPYNIEVLKRLKKRRNWAGVRHFFTSNNISQGLSGMIPGSYYTIRFQYQGIQARGLYRIQPSTLPSPRLMWYFPDNFRYFTQSE